ncbi:hypothetical protein RHGRI_022335 [Rhododendron griersonianum]|uniref:Uncharacterized protein n=1 Tax=Rhododendron griersonianum TaxID=479676 RepID=A0AAV6J164_9ERIC|nr:hypothetical protein RHGRI_022335 [Rhododendron griersonianum]
MRMMVVSDNPTITKLQYYLEKNIEARQKALEREADLEEKSPKEKAKSKMSKVVLPLLKGKCVRSRNHRHFRMQKQIERVEEF